MTNNIAPWQQELLDGLEHASHGVTLKWRLPTGAGKALDALKMPSSPAAYVQMVGRGKRVKPAAQVIIIDDIEGK